MNSSGAGQCEVKTSDDAWIAISIDEALERRGDKLRCPACHVAVRIRHSYTGSGRPFSERLRAHPGCPLKKTNVFGGRGLVGTRGRHDPVRVFQVISANQATFPIAVMARVLGVSEFHAWRRRPAAARATQAAFEPNVATILSLTGARPTHKMLEDTRSRPRGQPC